MTTSELIPSLGTGDGAEALAHIDTIKRARLVCRLVIACTSDASSLQDLQDLKEALEAALGITGSSIQAITSKEGGKIATIFVIPRDYVISKRDRLTELLNRIQRLPDGGITVDVYKAFIPARPIGNDGGGLFALGPSSRPAKDSTQSQAGGPVDLAKIHLPGAARTGSSQGTRPLPSRVHAVRRAWMGTGVRKIKP